MGKNCQIEHLSVNNIISHRQYEFITARSTSLHLLQVIDQWTETLDKSFAIDVIYLDSMKAFDSMPHKRLIRVMKHWQNRENTPMD